MKKLIILLFALLSQFPINSYSQSHTGIIKGRVSDSITGLPIENVVVFIPYTTKGTTTNSNGEYSLNGLPIGNYSVMFRHISYATATKSTKVIKKQPVILNMAISMNIYDIEEVTKEVTGADWEKGLILFQKHFLGNTTGTTCKIKNPKDLFFYYDGDILMARAKKPLVILNRYLGYEITYFLDYYKLLFEHIPDDKEGREKAREGLDALGRFRASRAEPVNTAKTLYYQSFSGSALYKDLAEGHPIRALNWKLNREAEFSGNLKHFLICLHRDTLSNSQYKLRKAKSDLADFEYTGSALNVDSIPVWDLRQNLPANLYYQTNEEFELTGRNLKTDPKSGEKILQLNEPLLIFYDTDYTIDLKDDRIAEISIKGGQLAFDSFGNFDAPEGSRIWVYHDSGVRLKVLLPNDFLPKSEK